MTQSFKENISKVLFEYWENISMVKELSDKEWEVIESSRDKINLRGLIVKSIAEGIEDTYNEKPKVRHALSAAEIRDKLEKQINEKITLSNIYFHLSKLEETDLVEIIGSLPSGRRFTAYYGRTARVFLLKHDKTKPIVPKFDTEKNQLLSDLIDIIKSRNPDIKLEKLTEISEKFSKANDHRLTNERTYTDMYTKWLEENTDILKKLDVNLVQFYFLFQEFINFQDYIVETFNELSDLIGFKEIISKFAKNSKK